jgi:hypothetical protein
MRETAQIFLSYTRADEDKVEQLYQRLSAAGFKPWMDTKDILPGEDWEVAIRRAIRHSDFFLACLSANSVNRRGFIQKEIKFALDIWQEMLDSDIYLIPVRLEDCETPEGLRKLMWVDLFAEDGWTRLLEAIRVGLERRPGGPQPTAQGPTASDELGEMRKKQLQKNIRESYALLDEYEDALRLAADPKEKTRYRREIERLREDIVRYSEELRTFEGGKPAAPTSRPEPSGRAINTGGGAYVEGGVHTGGGTFVGRDLLDRGGAGEPPVSRPRPPLSADQERIASLLRQRKKCHTNINRLEEMRLSYGANVPLDISNQLDDAREQLERIEQELEDLGGLS